MDYPERRRCLQFYSNPFNSCGAYTFYSNPFNISSYSFYSIRLILFPNNPSQFLIYIPTPAAEHPQYLLKDLALAQTHRLGKRVVEPALLVFLQVRQHVSGRHGNETHRVERRTATHAPCDVDARDVRHFDVQKDNVILQQQVDVHCGRELENIHRCAGEELGENAAEDAQVDDVVVDNKKLVRRLARREGAVSLGGCEDGGDVWSRELRLGHAF